ncbi:unnamed protein product, partial [Ectocarpus sp. 12 AP-2014]
TAVAAAERLDVSLGALRALAQYHMGDLRACLFTLQACKGRRRQANQQSRLSSASSSSSSSGGDYSVIDITEPTPSPRQGAVSTPTATSPSTAAAAGASGGATKGNKRR